MVGLVVTVALAVFMIGVAAAIYLSIGKAGWAWRLLASFLGIVLPFFLIVTASAGVDDEAGRWLSAYLGFRFGVALWIVIPTLLLWVASRS